jgi:hypothetical protein
MVMARLARSLRAITSPTDVIMTGRQVEKMTSSPSA